jgi:hypothetical protein
MPEQPPGASLPAPQLRKRLAQAGGGITGDAVLDAHLPPLEPGSEMLRLSAYSPHTPPPSRQLLDLPACELHSVPEQEEES